MKSHSGVLLRGNASGVEATSFGAWLGWLVLAAPASVITYETSAFGLWASADPENLLGALVFANLLALLIFGIWVSQLRTARDRLLERADRFRGELSSLYAAHAGDTWLRSELFLLGDALASSLDNQEWYRRRDRMRAETKGVLVEQVQAAASALSAAPGLSVPTAQLLLEQPTSNPAEPTEPAVEGQVRQLFHAALEAQTPASLVEFVEFCSRFRRHSIFNARLIQTQRRGARVCATAAEWERASRHILPDAQPIIILWPFGPTAHVYDVEDTGPVHDRAEIGDPFAATTTLSQDKIAAAITRLVKGCAASKQFHIDIVGDRLGFSLAGSAAAQGEVPVVLPDTAAATAHAKVAATPTEKVYLDAKGTKKGHWIPSWRVKMNDRMTPAEQLVTVAHELGHIFCGHLGDCGGHLRIPTKAATYSKLMAATIPD